MAKIRLALLGALTLASILFVVLYFGVSFNGWLGLVERIATVFVAGFAVSAAALLLTTMFRTADDLWATSYFRYMRCFWGEIWGGNGRTEVHDATSYRGVRYISRPLQISVCRATWLSLITIGLWALSISSLVFVLHFLLSGTLSGFEQISLIWSSESSTGGNIVSNMFVTVVVALLLILPLMAVGWRYSFGEEFPKLYRGVKWAYIIFMSVVALFALIVVPIKYAGIADYLLAAGVILATIATIAVAIYGCWLLFARALPKVKELLVKETVPGALASARRQGLKDKACPLIIQKIYEDKQ